MPHAGCWLRPLSQRAAGQCKPSAPTAFRPQGPGTDLTPSLHGGVCAACPRWAGTKQAEKQQLGTEGKWKGLEVKVGRERTGVAYLLTSRKFATRHSTEGTVEAMDR